MTKRNKIIIEVVVIFLMIALLTGALVYYNAIDKVPTTDLEENPGDGGDINYIPTGHQVGMRCPTYDLENVFDDDTTNITDFLGKVVVVNFWYTTCGPCVAELPYFNQIASQYKDDVVVLIVHAAFDFDDVAPFVNEHFPSTNMKAVFDKPGASNTDYYYSKLGGKQTYPMTVIVNGEGIITHNIKNPLNYDLLETYVNEAIND